MGRMAKGQKDPVEAVATLPRLANAAPELPSAAWPVAQRADTPPQDVVLALSSPPRWFDLVDPTAVPVSDRPRVGRRAILFVLGALVLSAVAFGWPFRVFIPVALAAVSIGLLVKSRRNLPRPAEPASRRLCLADGELLLHARDGGPAHTLLTTSDRFGVTLLATGRRDRVVALLSSNAGMAYVGASFDAASRRAFGGLLDRASAVSTDEGGLDAIGPDGEPVSLAPAALAALVDELSRRSPSCLERFVLTDARGGVLSLDGREFRAGGRVFDLSVPLEWRPFVFQEAFGHALAVYQGTWVRQGTNEVVLVCLLPSMTPALDDVGTLVPPQGRGTLHDVRLVHGMPESPPQAEHRVAVDRLLMVPIRSALDKAPRPAAQTARARA